MPQDLGWPVQRGGAGAEAPVEEAKVENFFSNRDEPQFGHWVPSQ